MKEKLGFPFGNFKLEDLMNLANRIEYRETGNERFLDVKVNGLWYANDGSEYIGLFAYVKFLEESLKNFINLRQASGDYETLSDRDYVNWLILSIDEYFREAKGDASSRFLLDKIGTESNILYLTMFFSSLKSVMYGQYEDLNVKASRLMKLLSIPVYDGEQNNYEKSFVSVREWLEVSEERSKELSLK